MRVQSLEVVSQRGERIPNTFYRQDQGAEHLAIVLPGVGYTAQMPLLYYISRLLLHEGADVFSVDYHSLFSKPEFQALSGEERERWLFEDVEAACRVALKQRTYTQLTLIGKSIGTLALGHLLAESSAVFPGQAEIKAIWLTPLLRNPQLQDRLLHTNVPSLLVIGTADPHYEPSVLDELKQQGKEALIVEGADHSLEVPGDLEKSLDVLKHLLRAVEKFLRSKS